MSDREKLEAELRCELIERLRAKRIQGDLDQETGFGRVMVADPDCSEAATQLEAMQAEIDRLRIALVDHNDRLRSACQVADRGGRDTNWLALRGQLHFTLAEHHEITNEARASLDKEGEK